MMNGNKTRRENLEGNYEDALFSLLVDEVMEKEGAEYIKENAHLQNDPMFKLPPRMDERCLQTIHESYRKTKQKKTYDRIHMFISKAAVFICVVMIMFSIPFFTVSAFRAASIDFLVRYFEDGSIVTSDSELDYESISVGRVPTWFPEGTWKVVYLSNEGLLYRIKYSDSNGNTISYSETPTTGSILSVDTENSKVIDDLQVNGAKSMMSIKDGCLVLTWVDDLNDVLAVLDLESSQKYIDPEIAVKIAESIK